MSRRPIQISTITRIMFLVLFGIIIFGYPLETLEVIIPISLPVLVWFIWRDQDRISQLEKRLAALENPSQPKKEES